MPTCVKIDGALTGLSKKMIRQIYGEAQFKRWRRGYDEPPPPISSFSSACEWWCPVFVCASAMTVVIVGSFA